MSRWTAEPWPAAEALFRQDPRWLGGDDAYSIRLGRERRIWLFGDTFVGPAGADRRDAALVHNTIAVQDGADPETASMTFRWDGDAERPRAVFTEPEPDTYLWPGDGAVVGDRLILFVMRIRPRKVTPRFWRIQALTNFEVVGWGAITIDDPTADLESWRPRPLAVPHTPFALLVGCGGVLVRGDHLYAHAVPRRGSRRDPKGHLLARWPLEIAAVGDLSSPSWWTGTGRGWVAQPRLADLPEPVAGPALTEFTVHDDQSTGQVIRTELLGLAFPRLRLRTAARPEGPWSRPTTLFRPPESRLGGVFCYAGKAHTGLTGTDLLVTYNSNARDLETVQERDDLYRPHCLRVRRSGDR